MKDEEQTINARRGAGEIFFEIVQRQGHHGFGEGNLSALAQAREQAGA